MSGTVKRGDCRQNHRAGLEKGDDVARVNQIPGCSRGTRRACGVPSGNVGARKSALSLEPDAMRPSVAIEQGTTTMGFELREPDHEGTLRSFPRAPKCGGDF